MQTKPGAFVDVTSWLPPAHGHAVGACGASRSWCSGSVRWAKFADASPAADLATVIAEALMADTPKARYLAGKGAREAAALARTPSDRVEDLAIAKDLGLPHPE